MEKNKWSPALDEIEGNSDWNSQRRTVEGDLTLCDHKVVRGRLAVQVFGLLALLVALILLGGRESGRMTVPGWSGSGSELAAEVYGHLPWLSVCCGVALLLSVARLTHGRWTLALRWADLGLRLLGILVLARLLLGAPLLGTNAIPLLDLAPQPERQLALMNLMVRLALAGALIGLIGHAIQRLASLLQGTYLDAWNAGRVVRYLLGIALGLCLTAPMALLLGSAAYLGPGLPLGLVLGASLDRQNEGTMV